MQRLKRDTHRVTIAMIYLALSLLLLGGASVYSLRTQHAGVRNIYRHPLTVSNAVRDIRIHLLTIDQQMHTIDPAMPKADLERARKSIMREEAEILQLFELVHARFLGDKNEVIAARNAFLTWQPLRHDVLAAIRQHDSNGAYHQANEQSLAHLAMLARKLEGLTDFAAHKADSFRATAERDYRTAVWTISLFIALLFVSAVLIAYVAIRSLRHSQKVVMRNLEQVEEGRTRYLELLNAFPGGIVIVDGHRRIQMVNRRVEEMFGYSEAELLQQPIEVLIPFHMREKHEKWVGRYLLDPRVYDVNQGRRLDASRKSGDTFPAAVSLSPVRFDNELLVTASIRDISDELRLEKRLLHAKKMEGVGTLVGGIAHEFNNILAGMVGNLYLMQVKVKDEQVQGYIRSLDQAANRAANIVKHLMAFSRQNILKTQQIDPLALVELSLSRCDLPQGIESIIDNRLKETCRIKGDTQMLQQALIGLVDNAGDALAETESPTITVNLQRVAGERVRGDFPELDQKRYVCIEVRDNGCGIPDPEMEQLFDPFFTTKEVGSGTGLGLAMIHGVIASHSGAIEVESEEGKGAAVRIYLPCLEEEEKAESSSTRPPRSQSGSEHVRTVLVADDEAAIREMLKNILLQLGYHPVAVQDGQEASDYFDRHGTEIEFVLLDILMPRLGGVDAARHIREQSPAMPVIFMTGYDRSVIAKNGIEQFERSAIIRKPFSIQSLLRVVEELQASGSSDSVADA